MRGLPHRTRLVKGNLLYRGVPAEYTEATLAEYTDIKKRTFFERYLNNLDDMYDDKMHLVLYGNNGTGKTYLSSILIKESYRQRYDSCMITLTQLMELTFNANKSEENLNKLNYIKRCHFLVIDEVGKENFTSTGSNVALLEDTLRKAITNGQVVILCSNLPVERICEQYGASVKSLVDGSFVKVKFEAQDQRQAVRKSKKASMILRGEI